MVRWLLAATVVASAGMIFAPASASADPLCEYVGASGVVNEQVGPVCLPYGGGTECDSGQIVLGNPETVTYEVCIPKP
jgi:hypothetical protein